MPILLPLFLLAFSTSGTKPVAAPVSLKNQACSAITRSEVEQAVGVPVAEGIGEESTCEFTTAGGLVVISIQRLPAELNLEEQIAAVKSAIPDGVLHRVAGLGQTAFLLDIPGTGTQLHVIEANRRYVMVSVFGYGVGSGPADMAEKLYRRCSPQ